MSDPGNQILNRSANTAFAFFFGGVFLTLILDSIAPFLIIATIGLIIALVGVRNAEIASKEHHVELNRIAMINGENSARMERETERIRILRLQNEAVAKEKNLDYNGAIEIWDYLGDHAQAKRILGKSAKLKKEGLIGDDEFKQMKKEILGK